MPELDSNNALSIEFVEDIPILTSWEQVENLPNFTETIDPKQIEIVDLFAPYDLHPFKKCGLLGCRTNHGDGFVAKASDGRLFKMGHCCGQKFFPERYKILKDSLTARFNEQTVRQEVMAAHAQSKGMQDKLLRVLAKKVGTTCVEGWYQPFHRLASTGFEAKTQERLKLRATQDRPTISISREVDEESMDKRDVEILEVSGMDSDYTEEKVHIIPGLQALRTYKKLHPSKLAQMVEQCAEFRSIDPRFLNQERLKHWHSWIIRFDSKLNELLQVAEDCRRFYAQGNVNAIRQYKHYL